MTDVKRSTPRIVVGVNGSAQSIDALRWALGQAEATGAVVEAVHAWDIPTGFGVAPTVLPGEDLAASAEHALATTVNLVTAEHPDVQVERRVLRGPPAGVLLDQAKAADLLVVGSRGHGSFAGTLLGSVSHQCTQHATCPVVVVRTGT